jgi:predicted phosphodiesterase
MEFSSHEDPADLSHANLEALQAIDEDRDAVLCMGDLVEYGPSPKECIAGLRLMGAVIVRGNHDNAVALREDCRCHGDYKLLSVATRQFTWQLLDPSEIEFLRQLPLTETLELAGTRFFLCHAAPSDPLFRYLPSSASDDEWTSEVAAVTETPKQAGEIRARWAWTEPSVWTERMLTALEQGVKGGKWFSLMDKVHRERTLWAAFQQVKANGGARAWITKRWKTSSAI